jgi:glycosyltransferase involved in cell wall biosynthesis
LTQIPHIPGVLLVVGAYYPEISSGGQQCRAVARALADRARFFVLATAVDQTLPTEDVVDGVPVFRLPIDVTDAASRVAATLRLVRTMVRLRRKVDVAHIHGVSSKNVPVTWLAALLRKPVVLTLHTAGQDEPQAIARHGWAASRAFRQADVVMSVSPILAARYRDAGLPTAHLRETINGIDTARFSPTSRDERRALRRGLGLPERPTILFVGFFGRDKRPEALFDAWLPIAQSAPEPPTLLFIGATKSTYYEIDPEVAPRMRARAEAAGVASALRFVEFTNEIEQYYKAADIFVLPSVREALPMALLEAMSSGLPVVASRLPGATDTIVTDGRDGVLVPPADGPAISQAIAALLNDPHRALRLGVAARDTISTRFSIARAAEDWLAAYQQALSRA